MEKVLNYYNTTGEDNQTVMDFSRKNHNQDKRILEVMKQNPNILYGASDLKKCFKNMPLTSIRRALNTLETKKKKIIRTNSKQVSMYGGKEFLYRYNG